MAALSLFRHISKVGANSIRPVELSAYLRGAGNTVLTCPRLPSLADQFRPSATTGKPTAAAHDHSKLWTAERALSAALIGLVPAAIAFPSDTLNYALAFSLTMHAHWGLEAIIVDYVRPTIFGPILPKISIAALYMFSIAVFGSLCYFNYSDVGIAQAIRMFWAV